jgi:hypothetical protein
MATLITEILRAQLARTVPGGTFVEAALRAWASSGSAKSNPRADDKGAAVAAAVLVELLGYLIAVL